MKKEFIPMDLALRLKALGFDEPCFAVFNQEEDLYICHSDSFESEDTFYSQQAIEEIGYKCLAPTFSQAFRWFRKNHNLKGYVSPVEYLDETADTYHWCIYDKCNSGNDQLTHEEAELACLIKLIEIVENIK